MRKSKARTFSPGLVKVNREGEIVALTSLYSLRQSGS